MTDRTRFDAWASARPEPRLSDWLREISAPDWEAMVAHPLTTALAAGSLPHPVFVRYLVQDYGFIDPFTALLGHAIGHAPAMADRVVLGQFVGMLTSDENTFFQRAFDAFDVPAGTRDRPDYLPVTDAFRDLLREVGDGQSYAEMMAVLVVTEWLYLSWATRVTAAPDLDPFYAEWIALHDNPDFVVFVEWLKTRLDAVGSELPDPAFARLAACFRRTVALERQFHDACLAAA